jgi:hypothetical protein
VLTRGGIPASHGFARLTFWTAGRSFVLWVDFAREPVSGPHLQEVNRDGRSTPATAFGFGRGPVYAVLAGRNKIVSLEGDLVREGKTFHKTLWTIAPVYRGPLLVRGARIGRPGVVRFSLGGPVRSDLRLRSAVFGTHDWRYVPSSTVLPGPGWYGLQVDRTAFSETIVFAAVR